MPLTVSRLAVLALATLGATLAFAGASQAREPQPALETIAALDLPRYLGTWYEIAKFPNRFQKQCDSDTTAQYSLLPDGRVQVLNRCRSASGRIVQAVGVARQPGGATSPRLEVRFAPAWLSFLPFVWGDYWVIDLDPGYRLAAVGEPGRDYLWILSRTPTVPDTVYAALLARLERQGYDTNRLERTRQAP